MGPSNEGHGSDLQGIHQPERTKRRRQDQDHEDPHDNETGPEYPLPRGSEKCTFPREDEGAHEPTFPDEDGGSLEDLLKDQDARASPGSLTGAPDSSQDVLNET